MLKRFYKHTQAITFIASMGVMFGIARPAYAEGLVSRFFSWASWGITSIADATVGNILVTVALFVNFIASLFLKITGWLIDYVIDLTVDGAFFSDLKVIDIAWAVIRDIVNIGLIFILLYIAISVVLQLSTFSTKELVAKVVIVALVVNFSLFITKFVIDASNVMAREFYHRTVVVTDNREYNSTSAIFMNGLGIQTISRVPDPGNKEKPSAPVVGGAEKNEATLNNFNVALVKFGGAAVVLVVAFAFLIAGLMFIKRAVILMFLMIFSPVAFLGFALGGAVDWGKKWWSMLLSESFMAPAFLFMVYMIARIMNHPSFTNVVPSGNAKVGWDLALSGDKGGFKIIFSYFIVLGLLALAIKVATGPGSAAAKFGVSAATSVRKKVQGYAGKISRGAVRQTIAKRASRFGNYGNRMALKHPRLGGATQRLIRRASNAGAVEDAANAHIEQGKAFKKPEEKAEYMYNLASSRSFTKQEAAKKMYREMSARERIELADNAPMGAIKSTISGKGGFESKLSQEERDKMTDERKKIKERETDLKTAKATEANINTLNTKGISKDDAEKALKGMSGKALKGLKKTALEEKNVIDNLSVRQLKALEKMDHITDEQYDKIYSTISTSSEANKDAVAYLKSKEGKEWWGPQGDDSGGENPKEAGGGPTIIKGNKYGPPAG